MSIGMLIDILRKYFKYFTPETQAMRFYDKLHKK